MSVLKCPFIHIYQLANGHEIEESEVIGHSRGETTQPDLSGRIQKFKLRELTEIKSIDRLAT